MSSYQQLAGAYDELTWDVGYEKRADFLEKLFRRSRIPVHTVLDLWTGPRRCWPPPGRKTLRQRCRRCFCTNPCPGWTCTAPWTPPSAVWTV